MARIGIIGSNGRMGQALARAIAEAGHDCSGGVGRGSQPGPLASQSDVLVDFSVPDAIAANLAAARVPGIPIVIGTTGLTDDHHRMIDEAAQVVPVLQTGNTSLGVALLTHLVKEAASRLGPEWDIEIVETHHRYKVDAPSGTALHLGQAAADGRGIDLAANSQRGRDGVTGARKEGTIGFASLRGGEIAGDHTVHFLSDYEHISLRHHAENRMIFASGAVRAATWLIGKTPGRYTMQDVLGL